MTLVLGLTPDEGERLRERVARQDASTYALDLVRQGITTPVRTHRIMASEGSGTDLWRGLDVDAYIREMRAEWD